MSDSIEDLVKKYKESVFYGRHPRSIGLFTIPEYPEYESKRGMWSAALDAILTTLRYLAPATILTLFWGQQSFFFRLLKHIDSAFRAIVFSSEEQKKSVLEWLSATGPVKVDTLETVWKHGWIVCGVLDAALPGACAGHPPSTLSIKHAQTIADHYLGVEPVFSRHELESNDALSKHQEWKFTTYLDRIRKALGKLTPPVSKPASQRTSPESMQITFDYVAKGSGLTAAQINNKMYFKIYPTAQQSIDPGEITILIRGPKDTYGMAVLPPILGKAQLIRQNLLGLQSKQNFTETALPITQGAAYLRNYGKNDMNKTYFIPKTRYDIEIEFEQKSDHAKVSYKVQLEGRHEIYLTCRGQNIVGSPFTVTASRDIIGILERDSFCLEDGEEIDIVDVKTDRKVVLRIVDFVTEKMLLRENGTLEKISDEEAKLLMSSANNELPELCRTCDVSAKIKEDQVNMNIRNKFKKAVNQIVMINRVCKIFNDLVEEKLFQTSLNAFMRPKQYTYIPDIVNSTFNDSITNPFIISEKVDKLIVPERISVSICTEKSKSYNDEFCDISTIINEKIDIGKTAPNLSQIELYESSTPDSLEKFTQHSELTEQDSIDRSTPLSANNPFLNDIYEENYTPQKELRTYVRSEYETNNCHNEEIQDNFIKIIIQESDSLPSSKQNNPFIDDNPKELERPKSPVFKIISGEISPQEDSLYSDTRNELISEEMLGNEFINPFFIHHHHPNAHEQLPIADFIIGAPVSLPPIIRVPSPEPITNQLRSLSIASEEMKKERTKIFDLTNDNENASELSQMDNLSSNKLGVSEKFTRNDNLSSKFHSLEMTDSSNQSNACAANHQCQIYDSDSSDRSSPPRKDIWDSAYVSIDENNTTTDGNSENTTVCEAVNKQKLCSGDNKYGLKKEEITNMGPAEREIWETCYELNDNICEDPKPSKWELKRPTFTPIIEENDRSTSSGAKEAYAENAHNEADTVTVAFAELNDMYQEYFPTSETVNANEFHDIKEENRNDVVSIRVDSASANVTDVKRHEEILEGTISEVQSNVTESISVSPTLHNEYTEEPNEYLKQNNNETQFCNKRNNIVLEKKKYWDERIKQIEAKSKEVNTLQKKRPASKQLKHDSLTKRKGKQVVKHLMNAGSHNQTTLVDTFDRIDSQTDESKSQKPITRYTSMPQEKAEVKIVEKWKKYWDEKLDTVETNKNFFTESNSSKPIDVPKLNEKKNIEYSNVNETNPNKEKTDKIQHQHIMETKEINNSKKTKEIESVMSELKIKQELGNLIKSTSKHTIDTSTEKSYSPLPLQNRVNKINLTSEASNETVIAKEEGKSDINVEFKAEYQETKIRPSPLPIKQEIPEEVYKAFETSPKRFFGTSRIHILNKIDTFMGKPNVEHKATVDIIEKSQDSGLVSSRISLFHNLTNIEELPWARTKSQSLHNIHQRKDSEKSIVMDKKDSGRSSVSSESGYVEYEKNNDTKMALAGPNVRDHTVTNVNNDEISIHTKKMKLLNSLKSSLDETTFIKANAIAAESKVLRYINNQEPSLVKNELREPRDIKKDVLRRKSISKSEMDIFSKVPNEPVDDYPDRYKSCDELPKINVKNFISLYESASRTSVDTNPLKVNRTSSMDLQKHLGTVSTTSGAAKFLEAATSHSTLKSSSTNSDSKHELRYNLPKHLTFSKRSETLSSVDTEDSIDIKVVKDNGKETTYVCLSDIELEIVESSPDQLVESSTEKITVAEHMEYKNRFKSAKEYFQSLEELREVKRPRKLNECEVLLQKKSTESLSDDKPQKRVKKKVKSRSLPSSEISKIWKQLQESQNEEHSTKLVKISEKFNVDDLFNDVMEGRLSRQGSLRGIPHKKAVLEAFRSMENITDKQPSPYELTVTQFNNLHPENQVKNAQTYLSEYPYLPTTDPSKYHSRLDPKASGLISFKELLETKPRRNSVPDLRLDPKFTVDL